MSHQTKSRPGEASKELSAEQIEAIRRNPPLHMSLVEAALYLGFSPRKLRQDLKARLFPHCKVGGRIIIRRDALDAAMKQLEVRAIGQ